MGRNQNAMPTCALCKAKTANHPKTGVVLDYRGHITAQAPCHKGKLLCIPCRMKVIEAANLLHQLGPAWILPPPRRKKRRHTAVIPPPEPVSSKD